MDAAFSPLPLCLAWFHDEPLACAAVVTPGFSGSRVFVVERPSSGERFVLKSFHAAATSAHALWVHRLLRHLRSVGFSQMPELIAAQNGNTLVCDAAGALWELSRFVCGEPVFSPTPLQAAAAAAALARWHVAAACFPGHDPGEQPSSGLRRRIEQAQMLQAVTWRDRRARLRRATSPATAGDFSEALVARFDAAISIFADVGGSAFVDRMAAMRPVPVVVQAVLRDVWCEHVLFADGHRADVAAIIDPHAAGIDTPATDLARLLGSWDAPAGCAGLPLASRWPEAMRAYGVVRPLLCGERDLCSLLHAAGVVCGLDNWFRWTLEEHRVFPDRGRVLTRIDRLLRQFPQEVTAPSVIDGIGD